MNKAYTYITLNDGNKIKLIIWDTAGQERFHSISLSTVKNSQGVILIFDLTNRQSFNDLNTWIDEIKQSTDKVSVLLFGNKCDIEKRKVSEEEAKKFAKDNKIPYIETSAKLNINITEGFNMIANDAFKRFGNTNAHNLKKKKKNSKKKGFC